MEIGDKPNKWSLVQAPVALQFEDLLSFLDLKEMGDRGGSLFPGDLDHVVDKLDSLTVHFLAEARPIAQFCADGFSYGPGANPFFSHEQVFVFQLIGRLSDGIS